jgi:sn-glycerol 3-phosphate transport system ATP-binding protein
MTLGDRLIVMDNGYAAQIGSPLEVYERPATIFVAGFIGSPSMNFMDAGIANDGRSLELNGGTHLPIQNDGMPSHAGQQVTLGIRPEHFELATERTGMLELKVDHTEILGADTLVHGHFVEDKTSLTVRLPAIHHFQKKTRLPLSVSSKNLHVFDKKNGNRIEK